MRCFFFIILILFPAVLFSQEKYHSSSKKAVKHFEQALKAFDSKDDENALKSVNKAIKADNGFVEAYFMKAQIYKEREDYLNAILYFEQGLGINPEINPSGYLTLARLEYNEGMYSEAMGHARDFLSIGIFNKVTAGEGEAFADLCSWAIEQVNNPVDFDPVNLGDSINSIKSEYWPSLSIDESKLVVTVLDPVDPLSPQKKASVQEDFYESGKYPDGTWGKLKNIGPPINTYDNEGAQSISADGRFLFFTGCNRDDGKGLCDIYFSQNISGKWSVPVNLGGPVNTRFAEKHPSVSSDGRRLYFASDRPGGSGGLDIWMSEIKNGVWSVPVNLGDSINTGLNERSPFIHPDNQTLYFSSDGHRNMGKGDIFYSRMKPDRSWEAPHNLGYPINTFNNELGLIVNASGDEAYFASDRIREKALDIYKFKLYQEARPVPVSYMKGRVFDANTMKGIEALFQLIDIETSEIVVESVSAPGEGDFLISLPVDKNYALNVSKPGYLFYSDHIAFMGVHLQTDPFIKDVPLKPIREGEKIILRNIFYNFDSWNLLPESEAELNKIVEFLNLNPGTGIEIGGHTDSTGSHAYNMELSEKRARSVTEYLKKNNITDSRLTYRGFGATQPLQPNDTEAGRAMNRRTELKILR